MSRQIELRNEEMKKVDYERSKSSG
jgi:hypothetical protein